jgi:hypothetical protein
LPYRSSRLEASEGCCKVSSSLTVLDTKKCSLGNRQTKKLETRSHFLRFKHRRKQGGYHCFTPMNGGGSDWRRLGGRLGWERERCGDNGGCIVAAAAWLVTYLAFTLLGVHRRGSPTSRLNTISRWHLSTPPGRSPQTHVFKMAVRGLHDELRRAGVEDNKASAQKALE